MREYSQFQASFWTGETGKRLQGNADAQLLAAYLFTSRHSNQIGLYYLPLAYASHELGMGIDRVSAAMQTVSSVGFARYDSDSEHVWVINMARRQITKSPKAIAGALKELRLCHAARLRGAFEARYGSQLERLHDTVSIPYPESPSDQDQDQTKTKPNQEHSPPAGARPEVPLVGVAADLVAHNHQASAPPVGANPALAELEQGEPDPEPGEPPQQAPASVSGPVLAELKDTIAAEAFRMGIERTPRAAESYYLQAAEDCVLIANRRGPGTLPAVCVEFARAALTLFRDRADGKGFGFSLQDASLGGPKPLPPARASPGRPARMVPTRGTTAKDFEHHPDEEEQLAALEAHWGKNAKA